MSKECAKLQISTKYRSQDPLWMEALNTRLNLLLCVICTALWMINWPTGVKNKTNKQKPKRKEHNIKPLIGEMTVLCLGDGWSCAAEDKSGNARAVNDFHCCVASSFQSAA